MAKKLAGTTVALVILLSLLIACAAPPVPPPSLPAPVTERTATLLITPKSGKPGTTIIMGGSGFIPGEEVKITVVMAGVTLAIGNSEVEKLVANEYGAFRIASKIPLAAVATPGVYIVKATGDKGSVGTFSLEVVK